MGNSPDTGQPLRERQYAFRGVFLDRAATIIYHCDAENKLYRGSYVFELTSEADLESFFYVAKPGLVYRFGPPAFDGSKLDPGSRYHSFRYALRWDSQRVTIHTRIIGNFDQPEATKQLRISFRPTR